MLTDAPNPSRPHPARLHNARVLTAHAPAPSLQIPPPTRQNCQYRLKTAHSAPIPHPPSAPRPTQITGNERKRLAFPQNRRLRHPVDSAIRRNNGFVSFDRQPKGPVAHACPLSSWWRGYPARAVPSTAARRPERLHWGIGTIALIPANFCVLGCGVAEWIHHLVNDAPAASAIVAAAGPTAPGTRSIQSARRWPAPAGTPP